MPKAIPRAQLKRIELLLTFWQRLRQLVGGEFPAVQ